MNSEQHVKNSVTIGFLEKLKKKGENSTALNVSTYTSSEKGEEHFHPSSER